MNIWKRFWESVWQLDCPLKSSIAPVYADTISILDEITDEETAEDYAEDTLTILARSSYLNLEMLRFRKLQVMKSRIYGLTQCHKKCSKVYLSLYLNGRSMEATEPINTGTLQRTMHQV